VRLHAFRAFAVATSIASGARAQVPGTRPSLAELREQVDRLQREVDRLDSQPSSRKVIDETVERVLRDSERRSRLLLESDSGFTAGYSDGKFILASADGNFSLHPWLQFQFRNTTNYLGSSDPGQDGDWQNGFEVRRLKLGFDGNVLTKDLTFGIIIANDRRTGAFATEEAYVRYAVPQTPFALRAGQFKDLFAHESMISSKRLLAADRSLVNDNFTGGDNYVQGVALECWPTSAVHSAVSVHDGARNNANQNFQDFPTNNADYGVATRVELKAMGDWKNYEDVTTLGTKEDLLVFGVALDYTEAGDTGILLHTVDVQYESASSGLAFYGGFYGRLSKDAPVSAAPVATQDLYDWGIVVQAAYLIDGRFEPYVRYDTISFDAQGLESGAADDQVHEFTVGANYDLRGHSAKFTVDAGWLPNGTPFSDDGAGVFANTGEHEFYLRAQFQLVI
jgi:hypothetical protein